MCVAGSGVFTCALSRCRGKVKSDQYASVRSTTVVHRLDYKTEPRLRLLDCYVAIEEIHGMPLHELRQLHPMREIAARERPDGS